MICSNCGFGDAQADPVGGRCPQCGTPYAAADAATTQQSFVAPESSPSSPYTQPYTIPAPPMIATGPTPPTAIPTYPTPPTNRRRSASRLVLISVGVVVAMALLGGIAYVITAHTMATAATSPTTATATVAASPTKVPGSAAKLYSDPNHQFTIAYPATWTVAATTTMLGSAAVNLTTFTAPNGHIAYLVAVASSPLAFSDIAQLTNNAVSNFTPNAPTTATIAKMSWQYEMGSATVLGKSGAVVAYLSPPSKMSYLLIAYSEGAKSPANFAKTFARIAHTFKPLG
jgi:hypothetical protein